MEALVTDKGNFIVKSADGLVAFFDKTGKLLREAKPEEWGWAKSRMTEAETKIVFDFSPLIGEKEKQKKEAREALVSFVGEEYATNILEFLGKEPEEFNLFGQMSPNWEAMAVCTGGCLYSHREWAEAWAVTKGGIKVVDQIMIVENAGHNANGSTSDANGFTANYLAAAYPEAEFFVIHCGHRYVTDHGSKTEVDEDDEWSVFARPNMEPIWAEWKEMADRKLNGFFLDIRNISRKEISKFQEAIRSIGISEPEITDMATESMRPDWAVSAVSEYGEMYSDRNEYKVWAFNPDGSIQEIPQMVMVDEEERELMADYEPSPYGYSLPYLKAEAPGALFFAMKEEHERHAERQASSTSHFWYLLRPLTKKELMIQKVNSDNSKKLTFGDLIAG